MLILYGWQETGTSLVNAFQFAVAEDYCIGVVFFQRSQQGYHRVALGWCTGVGCMTFLVEAALIANADGVGIVVAGMSAHHFFGAAYM